MITIMETTRASSYHVAQHRPARSENLQPQSHTERSSRPGLELNSVEDIWCLRMAPYALLVVYARKEEDNVGNYHHASQTMKS